MKHSKYVQSITLYISIALIAIAFNCVQVDAKTCHLRELDLCLASVLVFAQAPLNNKVTEADVNKQCHYFGDTESCFKNYTTTCTTKTQRLLIDFAADGVLHTLKEYCSPGSKVRKSFIKHGECLNIQRPKTNKCLMDFQAAIERSTSDNQRWRERPQTLCCAYDRYRNCMIGIIEPACGKEAVESGEMFVRALFSRAFQVTCTKYKHNSNTCKALLPQKGTIPKGPKSSSVISRLMSTITGIQ